MLRRTFGNAFVAGLYLIFATAQTAGFQAVEPAKPNAKTSKAKTEEVDAELAQRRTMGLSLISSLAEEARSFKDQTRRARIQARAADILWSADQEKARELFRRAWEAAETADADAAHDRAEEFRKLQSRGGVIRDRPALRSEILQLIARHDRKLGEQYLKALEEANEKTTTEASGSRGDDPASTSSQRLQLARRLVQEGQIERAMEFAAPGLTKVNVDSIFFLSALREKNAQVADTAFANLMNAVASDPLSDANTVSGLSSYLFTPFLYVTFGTNGGSNQSRERGPTPAPNVSPTLRSNFLRLAYQILMQPLPAPDQDHTTSGRNGKYLVIKRLLPMFDQFAADLSAGLRTQMTALASYVPPKLQELDNRAVTNGIVPDSDEGDPFQRMQERLDHAAKTEERDAIYAEYAVALTGKGDPRAHDLVDKIEESELRHNVKAYTDFQLAQLAVRNKDVTEIGRLAKSGELTSLQRVWAYARAVTLIKDTERTRAVEFLDAALAEAHRISDSDPDRARSLTAVAAGWVEIDPVRAWETLAEVVKAANSVDAFTGEDSVISSRLQTRQIVMQTLATAPDFDLNSVFRLLSKLDLLRAVQLAKTFAGEAPRAVAVLSIARSLLEKNENVITAALN